MNKLKTIKTKEGNYKMTMIAGIILLISLLLMIEPIAKIIIPDDETRKKVRQTAGVIAFTGGALLLVGIFGLIPGVGGLILFGTALFVFGFAIHSLVKIWTSKKTLEEKNGMIQDFPSVKTE